MARYLELVDLPCNPLISMQVDLDSFVEYGISEDRGGREVSCWICCKAGEEFAIVWKDERRNSELDGFDGSKGTVRIDGVRSRPRLPLEQDRRVHSKYAADAKLRVIIRNASGASAWARDSSSVRLLLPRATGRAVSRAALIFSNAVDSVTEDEFEQRADEGRLSGLGEIEVSIQRGTVEKGAHTSVRSKRPKFSDGTPNSVLRSGPRFSEEAKMTRDVSHTVRFGKPVTASNFHKFRSKDFMGGIHPDRVGWLEPHPYVTFRFKYRSKTFLAAQGHLVDDGTSTVRNTASHWDKDTRTIPDNAEIIEINSDSDDDDTCMDVDSHMGYERARSRTRFSTEPPSEDPAQLEMEREMLRAKLELNV